MVYLYRPSCTIWAIWDAQNRSHTRPLGRADQIIGFIVELETVYYTLNLFTVIYIYTYNTTYLLHKFHSQYGPAN